MGRLRNMVILTGHLGKDVEIHTFDNGQKKASVTLATKEKWKTKEGEDKEETQWHNLIAWGNTAEFLEKFLQKGQKVNVLGKLMYREYEKDGSTNRITEIVVSEFIPYQKPQ